MTYVLERDLTHAAVATADPGTTALSSGPGTRRGIYRRRLKRVFDTAAIIAALPIVLPVIAILALLIRRDGGPVFYSQNRVGREGRIFRFWKLRSMVVDAEARLEAHLAADPKARAEWNATQKLKDDPRVTRVGRLIRKTSMDELPQLWNVLRGDMSLVGPRPIMPDQLPLYPGRAYFSLRPGLTGFWQVGDRNETNFASRAVYDTSYARNVSFLTDIAVLFLTVRTVLRGTGY
jgi:lipopolysaccharide/colanic/teichoic acid biosynthesis glycosyltransferase